MYHRIILCNIWNVFKVNNKDLITTSFEKVVISEINQPYESFRFIVLQKILWDYSFSTYETFSKKLTFNPSGPNLELLCVRQSDAAPLL